MMMTMEQQQQQPPPPPPPMEPQQQPQHRVEKPLFVHRSVLERVAPSKHFGQKPTYSTIDISADRWLLLNDPCGVEKLENPPSLTDGLTRDAEAEVRYLGCELIQSGAILLKLPQTAAATGQILFHRYYYQKSFVRYPFEHVVMACLLLASKIEEAPRRPREVINVYHRLKQLHLRRATGSNTKLEHLALDPKYTALKNEVIKAERRVLNTLGFVVHVHHPHKLIYIYLHALGQLPPSKSAQQVGGGGGSSSFGGVAGGGGLLQRAWANMNDALRTDIFLRYRAETIACACIDLAARVMRVPLPRTPFPWYELFDASDRDVRAISTIIWRLYARKEVTPRLDRISVHLERLRKRMQKEDKAREEVAKRESTRKEVNAKLDSVLSKIIKPEDLRPSPASAAAKTASSSSKSRREPSASPPPARRRRISGGEKQSRSSAAIALGRGGGGADAYEDDEQQRRRKVVAPPPSSSSSYNHHHSSRDNERRAAERDGGGDRFVAFYKRGAGGHRERGGGGGGDYHRQHQISSASSSTTTTASKIRASSSSGGGSGGVSRR